MIALKEECRKKLIDVAKDRDTIYYSQLAAHLGVENRDPVIGECLDAIYEEEIRAGRPDLTLVVIAKDTGLGRFNSRGRRAREITVDSKKQDDIAAYIQELKQVHDLWARV